MAATLEAPKIIQDTGPKIIIPTLVEAPAPKNMPSVEQIAAWHDLICEADATSSKSVYKQRGVDPETFNGKCRFRPESLFPQHNVVDNSVVYRFNVIVLTGKRDDKNNWQIHMVKNGDADVPNFITVDAKAFLDNFQLV